MRLQSIFISEYKNLKNLTLHFESMSFLELFVGKNGSGKSNLFEALLDIFRHIYEAKIKNRSEPFAPSFTYKLAYNINGKDIAWEFNRLGLTSNHPQVDETCFPDNVLIYYSGQNATISGLLDKYESRFRRNIDTADIDDSRVFIGVGPDYKQILLSLITCLPYENHARQYVFQKLGLRERQDSIVFKLKRPRKSYAKGVVIDAFDPRTLYWGLRGLPRDFVDSLLKCIKGEFQHRDIYSEVNQQYQLNVDIELFRMEFDNISAASLFTLFDNLKALDMLVEITADLVLEDGSKIDLNFFSDGQYQSVYIYALTEIFKNRNSITLLDEPDSFLHPDWQFEFLNQIESISDAAASTNQVLMTSHSAATLMAYSAPSLNTIQKTVNGDSEVVLTCKSDIIKSLSGNKIFLEENQTIMSISTFLKNTHQPVLFTEGVSDEYILDIAWKKLYQDTPRPFCIQNAFDRKFLANTLSRDELRQAFPERVIFALFDFDEAYDDWNGLSHLKSKGGIDIENNPFNGLIRQLKHKTHYAMLLPVPNVESIKAQVLNSDNIPWREKGSESSMAIELLFYKDELIGTEFKKVQKAAGAELIVFSGDKVHFAKNYIPKLDSKEFEIFRAMFERIKGVIEAHNENVVLAS